MPAAARSMVRPPATDPVKLTKSKAPAAIRSSVVRWSRNRLTNTSSGTPASTKARTMRSPASSVCVACLMTTALPAIRAGATVLMAVRYGIVPRRDDEHHAERLAQDAAFEARAVLHHQRRQRALGDVGHVGGALADAAVFAAVADRPAHHPGELRHHLVGHFAQPVDAGAHQFDPLGQWPRGPVRAGRTAPPPPPRRPVRRWRPAVRRRASRRWGRRSGAWSGRS